ncbi:MAG: class I SAM-dependent methyltransferase, partial [Bacteroidota bacterium]
MSATHHCQVCGNKNIQRFFEMPPMPTQDGIMCDSREDALAFPSGSIDLHFCHDCSYIGNEGYEPDKISFDAYDFSLDHSPLFGQYIEGLADALIETYGLRQKQILDIGCGDGGFLEVICRRGNNRGIGIDSGFDHSRRKKTEGASIRYIQDYYSEKYRELALDFVCCRLVIDLLDDPGMILRSIRQNLEGRPNVPVFIEVPSAQYTFGERVIWNVVYEHRSWFSPVSLTCLMESCGFEVVETKSLWNDEFIGVVGLPNREAKPASVVDKEVQKMKKMIRGFRQDFAILLERSSS